MESQLKVKKQEDKSYFNQDTAMKMYAVKHPTHGASAPVKQHVPFLHELSRLKSLLKEKEISFLKLKEENMTLKQIERRHQKELSELEEKAQDAPRLIQALRNELHGLKNKLKETYTQHAQKDRRLRLLSEQNEKSRQELIELRSLVESQDLRMRNELQVEIDTTLSQMNQKDIQLQEIQRRCELLEKNFISESKNLRMKITSLERENDLFNDRIQTLDSTIRERDKEIATLTVYKYNALHRKPEPCRACQRRQMEEKEIARRKKCIERLPLLKKPRVQIVDSTLVTVELDLPVLTPECNYDLVKLFCSPQSAIGHPLTFDIEPIPGIAKVELRNLTIGEYYLIKVTPFIEDMKGMDSDFEAFVVDLLPCAPLTPEVTYQVNGANSKIIIQVKDDVNMSGGTPTHVYRLYHAVGTASQFHLLTELMPEKMEFTMHHPELAVPHFFRVTSVNKLGESQPSDIAGPCILDFPPSRLSPPIVKRNASQSVSLKYSPPPSVGESPIIKYLVVGHLLNSPEPAFSMEVAQTSMVIDDLSLGSEYVFAISAMNSSGWSPQSRFSDVICLEKMLPTPPPPQCIILSPNLVRCLLYTSMENEICPPCTGYKLWMAKTSDLSDNQVICPFVPVERDMPSEIMLENLEIGGNYWVSVSLIGVSQESALSPSVYLCMAAAIPLPSTPPSPTHPTAPSTTKPSNLHRATSRSIELTVAQRIQNMFKGNPAFAIPDDIKAQAESDGVKVLVKTASKSIDSLNNSAKREQVGQMYGHEKASSQLNSLSEKRTSYSGKKIKESLKSKNALADKKS